ncbi:hypothetical protein C6P41_003987 [Kluyveromyces marxianus]|nr:hypothetical protein C6P43_004638 [Kluyveromyces marxianus]KAG0682124.1 hypothetical protein C6P41_003987 [Kluyveromyces marxianus]
MSLVTPLQFSCVQPKFYRGAYPKEINLPFLKTLRLKYIISLLAEPITNDPVIAEFCEKEKIEPVLMQCLDDKSKSKDKVKSKDKDKSKVKRKKKPVPIEYDVVVECIKFLIDKNHYPCYIHCSTSNTEVTSLVVACLRKLSYWSTVSIFNEYMTYTSSINIHERNFIENFNLDINIEGIKPSDKVSWIIVRSKQHSGKRAQSKQSSTNSEGPPQLNPPKMPLPTLTFHND